MPRASLRPLSVAPNAAGRLSSPGPPSPSYSEVTNASQMNLGANGPDKIITRGDLKSSLQGYEYLMGTCAEYRTVLLQMSKATAAFADALQTCSGLKGASYESGTRLQAAAGLHHLMGNHWHVLSDTLDKNFERPLRQYLDNYRLIVSERSASYEKALREKSKIIRQTEMENMNIGRKKQRNLQTFREALAVLQRQVDGLDELRVAHYQEILEHEEEVWDFVQGKVCLAVRSTLDVFDRFAAKASDPILEPMLNSIPDPFDSYGPPKPEDQIFSILPPLAILSNAPSPSPSPLTGTPTIEALPEFAAEETNWVDNHHGYSSSEWARATSPGSTSPPAAASKLLVTTSTSPPDTSRRHSYPSSSGKATQQPRKSETKLRTVLSVIDETRTSSSRARERSTDTVRPSSPELYGQTQEYDLDWRQHSLTNRTPSDPEEVTDLESRHPGADPAGPDPPIVTRSPNSDETAHLQSTM